MSEYVVCQNCGYPYITPTAKDCPKCGSSKYKSIGSTDDLFARVKWLSLVREWWKSHADS